MTSMHMANPNLNASVPQSEEAFDLGALDEQLCMASWQCPLPWEEATPAEQECDNYFNALEHEIASTMKKIPQTTKRNLKKYIESAPLNEVEKDLLGPAYDGQPARYGVTLCIVLSVYIL